MESLKRILLLFVLCVMCATGCKKDDDQLNGGVVIPGELMTVESNANSDATVSNLQSAVQRVFGADYALSKTPLRIAVTGTINAADFAVLKSFTEVDLTAAQVVGTMTVAVEIDGTISKDTTVEGNAIPVSAFAGSSTVQLIKLPVGDNAVTHIGGLAFGGCSKLAYVSGFDKVTSIEDLAFANCALLDLDGSDSGVGFASWAGLQNIGDSAFSGCDLFQYVDLSLSVGSETSGLVIGEKAFSACDALAIATLPQGFKGIGVNSFSDCDKLVEIISKLVESDVVPNIEGGALPTNFRNDAVKEAITVCPVKIENNTMRNYSAASGWSDYNLQSSDPCDYKTVYSVSTTTNSTLDQALRNLYGADYRDADYSSAENRLSIKVTGTINAADFSIMRGCFKAVDLSDATVVGPVTLNTLGDMTQTGNAIPAGIFSSDDSYIEEFYIPETVTYIGDQAFQYNQYLKKIDLTTINNLTIGNSAFRGAAKLCTADVLGDANDTTNTTLVIPANVVAIGEYAFDEISTYSTIITRAASALGATGNQITNIEFKGTSFAPTITTNSLPSKFLLTGEDGDADDNTSSALVVPQSAAGYFNTLSWQQYKRRAVTVDESTSTAAYSKIKSYIVSNTADEIDSTNANLDEALANVFGSNYASETKVVVTGTMNTADFAELMTFSDIDLTDVTIVGAVYVSSNTAPTMGMALPGCAFSAPTATTAIKEYVNSNRNLKRLVLPKAVVELGQYSLAGCPNLETIIFPEGMTVLKFGTGVFASSGIKSFPGESGVKTEDFTSKTGIINFPRDLSAVQNSMFKNCLSLLTVDFSEFKSLTTIVTNGFSGCVNMTSVTFPEEADGGIFGFIQNTAFYNCSKLSNINLPTSLWQLGDKCFNLCTSLTNITIPCAVMGSTAASLEVNASRTAMSGVFAGCDALVKVNVSWPRVIPGTYENEVIYPPIVYYTDTPVTNTNGVTTTYLQTFPDSFKKGGARSITVAANDYYSATQLEEMYNSVAGWSELNVTYSSTTGDSSIHVETAGTLASLLGSKILPSEYAITGNLNTDDLSTINGFTTVTDLDLSGATIEGNEIAANQFKGNGTLAILTLPNSVTTIGESAFEGTTALSIIFMPSSLKTVADSAFKDATALTTCSLPEGLTSLGKSAFSGCANLVNISLPSTLTGSINEYAFYGAGVKSLIIPAGITSVDASAFASSKLSSVVIPSNVTNIAKDSFSKSMISSLEVVSLAGATATTIGESAFAYCSELSSVLFTLESATDSDGVVDSTKSADLVIGAYAFQGCPSLGELSMTSYISAIGEKAFYNCDNFLKLYCSWKSAPAAEKLGADFLPTQMQNAGYAGNNQVGGDGKVMLPNGSSSSDYATMERYNLVEVDTDITVETAKGGLRTAILKRWPSFLTAAEGDFPNIVVVGEMNATDFEILQYKYTPADTDTEIDLSFTTIDLSGVSVENNLLPASAFSGNSKLSSIILPSTISVIDDSAFYNCTLLTTVNFPPALTEIGSNAFYKCPIKTISDLRNLETIEGSAFSTCTYLTSVDLSKSTKLVLLSTYTNIFSGCTTLASASLPSELTFIPQGMFNNCKKLEAITLPEGVTEIARIAFQNCTSLSTVSLPSTLETFTINTSDSSNAFYGCTGLTSVYVPWSKSEDIPTVVSDVFPSGFTAASGKYPILIPSSVDASVYTSVDGWDNYNLVNDGQNRLTMKTTMELSESLTNMWGDDVPTELEIDGVVKAADFAGWGAILSKFGITTLNMSGLSIVNTDNSQSTIIPADWWNLSLEGWTGNTKAALKSITLPSTITSFEARAFKSCSVLASINIDNLITIKESAFEGCNAITSLTFPASLVSIEKNAFKNAKGLQSIATTSLNNATLTMGEYAFSGCIALNSVTLNSGVAALYPGVFSGCTELASLTIPSTVNSFGVTAVSAGTDSIIEGCSSLANITLNWITSGALPYVNEDTFPEEFKSTYSGGTKSTFFVPSGSEGIYTSATSSNGWNQYNILEQTSYTVACDTAGTLASAILDKALTSGQIRVTGVMNESDFAALQPFSDIDLSYVSIVDAINISNDVTGTLAGNAIPRSAFVDNVTITKLVLPTTVTEIGTDAFSGCTNLKTISSSSSLDLALSSIVKIHNRAFKACTSLAIDLSTKFPEVVYLGSEAFAAAGLSSPLTISTKIQEFGCLDGTNSNVFTGCAFSTEEDADGKVGGVVINYTLETLPTVYANTFPVDFTLVGFKGIQLAVDNTVENAVAIKAAGKGWENYNFYVDMVVDPSTVINPDADESDKTVNTLAALIPADVMEAKERIVVKGEMNEADFASIKDFKYVDLSGVTIVGTVTQQGAGYPSSVVSAAEVDCAVTMTLPAFAFSSLQESFVTMSDADRQNTKTGFFYRGNSTYYVENTTLEEIVLPSSLAYIGAGAFAYCTSLKKVTFGDYSVGGSFTTVGVGAFSGTSFESVGIADSEATASLYDLALPSSVTTLSQSAWQYTPALLTVDFTRGQNDASLAGRNIFDNCTSLRSALYPVGYTNSFGIQTFQACTSLAYFDIPDNTSTLENNFLKTCTSLVTIDIPAYSSTLIGKLFVGSSAMTSIYVHWISPDIPSTYAYNGDAAASFPPQFVKGNETGCVIYIPDGQMANYQAKDYWASYELKEIGEAKNVLTNTAVGELSTVIVNQWSSASEVPSSIMVNGPIGSADYMALNSSLLSNVTEINMIEATLAGDGADNGAYIAANSFVGNSKLETLVLPSGIKGLGDSAFSGCSALTKISGIDYLEILGDKVFSGTSLTTYDIPATMTSIGSEIFGTNEMTEITVPWSSNVTCEVSATAFPENFRMPRGDGKLSITPPSSILYDADDIYTTSNWSSFIMGEYKPDDVTLTGVVAGTLAARLAETGVTPNTISQVTISGELSYYDMQSLIGFSYLDLSGVTAMYNGSDASSIGDATTAFPPTFCCNETYASATSTLTAAEAAVLSLNLVDIRLPQNITTIADWAFGGSANLETVVWNKIADNTNGIGVQSFRGCVKFDNDDVNAILKDLDKLNNNGFNSCTGITEIYFDDCFVSMANNNFQNCSNLKKIHFTGDSAPTMAMASVNFPVATTNYFLKSDVPNAWIVLPSNAQGKYTITASTDEASGSVTGTKWEDYYNVLFEGEALPEDVTEVTSSAGGLSAAIAAVASPTTSIKVTGSMSADDFAALSGFVTIDLSSVTIADNTIPASAFANYTSLITLTLPTTVTVIGDSAFAGCTSLVSLSGLDNVVKFGSYALSGVPYSEFTMPSSVTSIGDHLFGESSTLSKLTLPWSSDVTCVVTALSFPSSYLKVGGTNYITVPDAIADDAFAVYTGDIWAEYSIGKLDKIVQSEDVVITGVEAGGLAAAMVANGAAPTTEYSITVSGSVNSDELSLLLGYATVDLSGVTMYSSGAVTTTFPATWNADTTMSTATEAKKLVSIALPDGTATISALSFKNCSLLENVSWVKPTSGAVYIMDSAFNTCAKLNNEMVSSLFKYDSTLELKLGSNVFGNNTLITDVTIDADLAQLWNKIFLGCTNLMKITFTDTTPTQNGSDSLFPSQFLTGGGGVIYVPEIGDFSESTAVYSYQNWITTYGYNVQVTVEPDASITSLTVANSAAGNLAAAIAAEVSTQNAIAENITSVAVTGEVNYYDLQSLTGYSTIDLSGVTALYSEDTAGSTSATSIKTFPATFTSNTTLVSMTLPSELVTQIATSAFSGCTNLESFTWTKLNNSAILNSSAFAYCTKLDDSTVNHILSGVSQLKGNNIFQDIDNLTAVVIDGSITIMWPKVFSYCDNLVSITFTSTNTATYNTNSEFFPTQFKKDSTTGIQGIVYVPDTEGLYAEWISSTNNWNVVVSE